MKSAVLIITGTLFTLWSCSQKETAVISGEVNFNEAFYGTDTVSVPLEDDMLNLRVLIDHSLVEVFIQNGKYTITN